MAFSNPQVYMDELAAPLYHRFAAEPTSYELAISTCIILYHFTDVVAYVQGSKPHVVSEQIAAKVPAFQTIRAIANAGKHVELTRHPMSDLLGLRAEHLVRGIEAAFSNGPHDSNDRTHSDAREAVVVALPNGQKHNVLHLCGSVLAEIYRNPEFFYV